MGRKSREKGNSAQKYTNQKRINEIKEQEKEENCAENSTNSIPVNEICAFSRCKRPIDPLKDEYHRTKNGKCYHKACYEMLLKASEFTRMWQDSINREENVRKIKSAFFRNVYDLGFSEDYVLFGLKYCVNNKMSLNFPPGLKYYLEFDEVKDAYDVACGKKKPKRIVKINDFRVDKEEKSAQKFNYVEKNRGFSSIFK